MARASIPRYRRQKRPKGRDAAFVQVDGQRVYLGPHGSPESREAYGKVIAELEASGGMAPVPAEVITVSELAAQFWTHAETYYRRPDGTPTSEVRNFRYALRPLIATYGRCRVSEFGPRALRAVRCQMIKLRWCRSHINKSVGRIKHVFRWGTEHELVPSSIYHALQAVRGLAPGRSDARESEPKLPVPEHDIEAVRTHVSRQVWALIQLQLLTGARSGELLCLRAIDIDMAGSVWTHRPRQHKTSHHGHTRTILFGPRCQRVLAPFIGDRPVDAFLFNPCEAEAERHAKAPTHRRSDQQPNPRKTERTVGDHYTAESYRRPIARACRAANVPVWSGHRLRHNAATRLRAEFGIDVAQTILGHRLGSHITELYAEPNLRKAVDVIRQVG